MFVPLLVRPNSQNVVIVVDKVMHAITARIRQRHIASGSGRKPAELQTKCDTYEKAFEVLRHIRAGDALESIVPGERCELLLRLSDNSPVSIDLDLHCFYWLLEMWCHWTSDSELQVLLQSVPARRKPAPTPRVSQLAALKATEMWGYSFVCIE